MWALWIAVGWIGLYILGAVVVTLAVRSHRWHERMRRRFEANWRRSLGQQAAEVGD